MNGSNIIVSTAHIPVEHLQYFLTFVPTRNLSDCRGTFLQAKSAAMSQALRRGNFFASHSGRVVMPCKSAFTGKRIAFPTQRLQRRQSAATVRAFIREWPDPDFIAGVALPESTRDSGLIPTCHLSVQVFIHCDFCCFSLWCVQR